VASVSAINSIAVEAALVLEAVLDQPEPGVGPQRGVREHGADLGLGGGTGLAERGGGQYAPLEAGAART
jgi:hypothetical protein